MSSSSPIVFVHGLIGSLQVPDLLRHFEQGRAIAPDLVGYGSLRDALPGDVNLREQVSHLRRTIKKAFGSEPVHLVGHSIGGVVAALFAHEFAESVNSIVNVEGNFTLKDAFWSSSVARMSATEADEMLDGFRQQPGEWLARSGIPSNPINLEIGRYWLAHQPASTVRSMAQSVVTETGPPDHLLMLRSIFSRHRVHLVAGERSRADWEVPDWALQAAASFTTMTSAGHMMMLEAPIEFALMVRNLLQEN